MFIISLTYTCDISKIEKHLDAHINYLDKYYENGVFLASGRKVPRNGGVILAKTEDIKQLERILMDDPFHIHNLAKYELTEFIPTKTIPELSFLT